MKIAVASRAVAPLHGRGGLERAVADGCAALVARGHDVTLFTAIATATATTPREGDAAPLPFRVVTVPWTRGPFSLPVPLLRRGGVLDRAAWYGGFVRRLAAAIDGTGETYDAAIGHGAAAAAFVPPLHAGRVRRLLVNPHGMEEFAAPPVKRLFLRGQQSLVRAAAATADRVIATDAALVPAVERYLRVPPECIAVVPNGVNVGAIDALDAQVLRDMPPNDAPLLVSVGRMEANKGLDVLVAALSWEREALPAGWRWLHVGVGSARGRVTRAVRAAGLTPHVTFAGAVPDAALHALLARATLFVHPARYEGSSLVTLEAMAHHLPVVATAVGGIPDKVKHGKTGWLVPPNDASALGAAIRTALRTSPDTLRAMGAHGRARVERDYSLIAVTARLLEVIAAIPAR